MYLSAGLNYSEHAANTGGERYQGNGRLYAGLLYSGLWWFGGRVIYGYKGGRHVNLTNTTVFSKQA